MKPTTFGVAPSGQAGHIFGMRTIAMLVAGLMTLWSVPASASSTQWYQTEGANIRLITSGLPDASGKLSGVLQIDLRPGWKTYWRDPGDAGVPPSLDVSRSVNVTSAELHFPAPERFEDASGHWAGYKHPVDLPVTFVVKVPGDPAVIEADVFLGVCETVCIPVQLSISVDPAAQPDDADDVATVEAALAALPGPEQPDFGVTPLPSGDPDTILVEAAFPGEPEGVEFFLAASDGFAFGAPERTEVDGKLRFKVPVLDRPGEKPTQGSLRYTLAARVSAVDGFIPFP